MTPLGLMSEERESLRLTDVWALAQVEVNTPPLQTDHEVEAPGQEAEIDGMLLAPKRTYQPSVLKRKRRHGFLKR